MAQETTGGAPIPAAGGTSVVRAQAELDWETAAAFTAEVQAVLDSGAGPVVVDLAAVRFMDSSVLQTLLLARRRMTAEGRALVLAGPLHPTVRRLFDVVDLGDHLAFADDLPAALAAVEGAGRGTHHPNG
ncbi:STAS domain-containing protein [Kitasatospora sp. NPDC001664]